jgi:signal transduction histidine kinase
VRATAAGLVDDLEVQRQFAIEKMKTDPALLSAVGDVLRKDLEDNLSQSHDFLQLVKVIRGHAEVLLLQKHPDLPPEEAAEREPTEGAIYFATTLMATKVDSLIFLNEVNRAFGDLRRFEIHPLILKYVRIYAWQAKQKGLRLELIGRCFAVCYYNPDAVIAIVQGFLDNMVKYAPAGSAGSINIVEGDDDVRVDFTSLGPRIAPDETQKIFLPRIRGVAARELEPSGQGVGLGVVKELSDALDLNVRVDQRPTESDGHPGYFATTFHVTMRKTGTSHRAH